MKLNSTLVTLALGVLTYLPAKAQFKAIYSPINGQDKVVINTDISGIDTTHTVFISILVSNNSNMSPIVGSVNDSAKNKISLSRTDSIGLSLTNPTYYYVSVLVTSRDTLGIIDTATSIAYLPIVITPTFTKPTQKATAPSVTSTDATFGVDFTSGFDTANYKVIVSYGDTVFKNPVWNYPASSGKVIPKIGSNQINSKTITLNMGASNYMFSYRIMISNSIGSDTSQIYYSITSVKSAAASVSSPFNTSSTEDSVYFSDITNTTGLQTKHIAYISKMQNGAPFDSIVSTISAGQNAVSTTNAFGKLSPLTSYWVWSKVYNSMNINPDISTRVQVYTTKQKEKFKITNDSNMCTGPATQSLYYTVTMPFGDSARIIILIDGQSQPLYDGWFGAGIHNVIANAIGLSNGTTYYVTAYGQNSVSPILQYQPWAEIADTFVFQYKIDSSWNNNGKNTLPLVVVVDSFGDQNATTTRCYYKYVVPSGKKVDLWAEASIDPDTGITGPNFSKKILSGATATAHGYFDIPNQTKGDLIYVTIYGQTQDTSHQLVRKQLIATHLFLGVTMSNGIQNDFYLSSFSIYPNPAKDYITIHTSTIGAEFVLYDLTGKLVKKQKLTSFDTQISVTDLEKGLYFINTGNKIIVE